MRMTSGAGDPGDVEYQLVETIARVVGRERVIAGADCGFAQGALYQRQHPTVMWAKFDALVEGAKLTTARLWGH